MVSKMVTGFNDVYTFGLAVIAGYMIGYSSVQQNMTACEEIENDESSKKFDDGSSGMEGILNGILPYYSGLSVIVFFGIIYKEFSTSELFNRVYKGSTQTGILKRKSTSNTPIKLTNEAFAKNNVKTEELLGPDSSHGSSGDGDKNVEEKKRPSPQRTAAPNVVETKPATEDNTNSNSIDASKPNTDDKISQSNNFKDLSGAYKTVKFDNFEAFLTLMGAPWAARKMILSESPINTIKMTDKVFHLKVSGLAKMDNEYQIGGPPIKTGSNANNFAQETCLLLDDGSVRIHKKFEKKVEADFDRSLSDDGKTLTMKITGKKGNKEVKASVTLVRQ